MSSPSPRTRICARKALLIAFGLVALTLVSAATGKGTNNHAALQQVAVVDEEQAQAYQPKPNTREETPGNNEGRVELSGEERRQAEQAAEAARAYKHAMATLASITVHTSASSHGPSWVYSSAPTFTASTNPLLSYFLPSLQGQGPVGSALRIVVKLHHQFRDALLSIGFGTSGRPNKGKKGWDAEEDIKIKAIKVVDLLEHAADLGHDKAKFALAQLHLFPPTKHFEFAPGPALKWLNEHVAETGNASTHGLLGFFYASGYRPFMEGQGYPLVEPDQALAQLHYTFAAHEGDKGAQMALGYRYWSGIGTVEDCQRALEWYEAASESAMKKFVAGPPGGRTLPQTPTRLSDLVGGVYGPGASVASTGENTQRAAIKAGAARAAGETWEDVLDYYTFNADRGEVDFAYRLGKIFYHGSIYASPGGIASGSEGVSAVPRDIPRARYYFLKIARQVWPRDPADPSHYNPAINKADDQGDRTSRSYAAASAGFLGRMALRGEGVRADPAVAKLWFERGAMYGDRECHNGLGIIYRDGLLNGKPDIKKAVHYFKAAAVQELAEAEVNLGKHHYARGEIALATGYFDLAMRHGSPFEAHYYLGLIYSAQANSPNIAEHIAASSCAMAVSFHKVVSERGVWDDDLLRDAEIAWVEGSDRGKEVAMLKWWIAAERGHEIAQSNLAFILDQDKSVLRLTRFSPITPSNVTAKLALTQWTRAAGQRNIDALVKVGDYYYHGLGVSEESNEGRFEKAAKYYQAAVDTRVSALAMWNLGWMYENGIGVPQDFHLAKRHYDAALDTNPESYIPILISLGKLYAKSIWHTLNGGENGLALWELDEDEYMYTDNAMEPENRQLDGSSREQSNKQPLKSDEDMYGSSDDDDGTWYHGKAKQEFDRRRNQLENPGREVHEEDDPIQWARDRRNAEAEQDGDFGPENDFEGALRGARRGEEEEQFSETMLLVVLCVAVSVLLYIRSRLMERIRRQNGQAQGAAPNGVFPPPGDPARGEWMVAH